MRCSVFAFIFFPSSGAPRPLHSSPTRRSSDLPGRPAALRAVREGRIEQLAEIDVAFPRLHGSYGERSEEHTSELQSRGHLVCRLQLAKKKRVYAMLNLNDEYHIHPC